MLVFEERGKPEYPEKNHSVQTTNRRNPRMTPSPGIEPRQHLWEVRALTTAPSLQLMQFFLHFCANVSFFSGFRRFLHDVQLPFNCALSRHLNGVDPMEMTTSVASARVEHIAGCVLTLQILING